MLIEINGAYLNNKGAEFMLQTCIEEISSRIDSVFFATDNAAGNYITRSKHSLHQFLYSRGWYDNSSYHKWLKRQLVINDLLNCLGISKRLLNYGITNINEIHTLIDISGLAYSDFWGVMPSNNFSKLVSEYKKRGKKIILLSQSYGPFNNQGIRGYISEIINKADLVYAREESSKRYLNEIVPDKTVSVKPDLTFSRHNVDIEKQREKNRQIATIIPNIRMLKSSNEYWKNHYISALKVISEFLVSKSWRVNYVINESSGGDYRLIMDNGFPDGEVSVSSSPSESKRLISDSDFIIGSRYHSLIASFLKGIPSVSIGWADKYEELYKNFGVSDFNVNNTEELFEKVQELMNYEQNEYIRKRIQSKLNEMVERNNIMWDQVVKEILK